MNQAVSDATGRSQEPAEQSLRAFERDLPVLFQQRPGEWVAYRGEQPIAFAAAKHQLYQQCLDRGLARDQFVVFCIEAQETEITLGPVVLD
jgi:hypothetical protein